MGGLLDVILHLDKHLGEVINQHGTATYLILAAILFCETGLVVTPFLPGDSLLFAVGIFCHPDKSDLNLGLVFLTLCVAVLLGDTCNYFLGKTLGHRLFRNPNSKILNPKHLETTHEFFEKHGRMTIILARFVPIVRTFAPFVAGMGSLPYRKFIGFSFVGVVVWVGLFLLAGYFIGRIPAVEKNFTLAILAMVIVTGAPLVWEVVKGARKSKAKSTLGSQPERE